MLNCDFGCMFVVQRETTSFKEMLIFVVKWIAVMWLLYFKVLDWNRVDEQDEH